jgi:hypothetical protein
MNSSRPNDRVIDALVRAHLRREADAVDASAILKAVRGARATRSPGGRAALRASRLALYALAAAVSVLVAFLGGRHFGPGQASAETLVREARQAHALPLDRCYLVQIVPDPEGLLARHPWLSQARENRLWTRGDRFWVESTNPERRWAWGRDDQRGVWLAPGRSRGARFERDEVPERLNAVCDVCGMRVETLLDEVLAGFQLTRERPDSAAGPAATYRVRAEPKPGGGSPFLRSAVLEVDAETRVLRRLVLERTRRGQPLATVTFTLVETGTQSDLSYQLEGHLDPDAPVYSTTNTPPRRALLLRAFLGLPPAKAGP